MNIIWKDLIFRLALLCSGMIQILRFCAREFFFCFLFFANGPVYVVHDGRHSWACIDDEKNENFHVSRATSIFSSAENTKTAGAVWSFLIAFFLR